MTASFAPVLRFAPSPNGRLHLGHAYSALLNARVAERFFGRFLVRLEDIDPLRCTDILSRHCLEDLAWLGLRWEEPVRRQSQHFADYQQALDKLHARGLLYPCFCTRKQIAEASHGTDPEGAPLYPGTCAHLAPGIVGMRISAGDAHAWRLHMPRALEAINTPLHYRQFTLERLEEYDIPLSPGLWGDVVLARKETPTSYHLSVVVDDALQGITHVLRGVDLEPATAIHRVLQELLALPAPRYHHHGLLTSDAGEKLAKSKGSPSLAELREQGVTVEAILASLPLPI